MQSTGLTWSTDPSSALARPILPPRRKNSSVATEKKVCTRSRIALARWTIASALSPCAAIWEAASVRRPSDMETSCESITRTRFESVISDACTADAYVPLSFSEMCIEMTSPWSESSSL